jgi:hypothetical protein
MESKFRFQWGSLKSEPKIGIPNQGQKIIDGEMGTSNNLCDEHQRSIIQAALENALAKGKRFDDALLQYADGQRAEEEVAMQNKIEASREDYIIGVYFYEMYHSDRCWKTARVAKSTIWNVGVVRLQDYKQ